MQTRDAWSRYFFLPFSNDSCALLELSAATENEHDARRGTIKSTRQWNTQLGYLIELTCQIIARSVIDGR